MADSSEPKVGMRIRALREQNGLSMRGLAERCGISINAISQIERGDNSPTVSTLHRLATALEIPISEFFQAETRQKTVVVRRDQGLRAQSTGVIMESLGIGLSGQQLEPFRMVIEPGVGTTADPIAHSGEEFVHCLEGEIEYRIGEDLLRLEPGDSVLFDASQLHAVRNPTTEPAVLLLVFQAFQDRQRVREIHMEKL